MKRSEPNTRALRSDRPALDLEKCDLIKVAMMLTVIFYHCICYWSKDGWFVGRPEEPSAVLEFLCGWLNTIHVYAFTFLSGYLFYFLRYEKKRYTSFVRDVAQRAKRLLVPYGAACLWVVPLHCLFFRPAGMELVKKFVLAASPSQLWFLVMLFGVFCLFYPLSDLLERKGLRWGVVIFCVCYALGCYGARNYFNLFQIWNVLRYLPFFYMGFAFRKYSGGSLNRVPWWVWLVVNLGLFSVSFYCGLPRTGQLGLVLSDGVKLVCSLSGVLAVVLGLSELDAHGLLQRPLLRFLKKHNFVMYLLHQQLIYIVLSLLVDKVSTPVMVLTNVVFSVTVSAAMAAGISAVPVVKKIFGYR